ncbi:Lrp/AsnC family transcriptional regulator [Microbacterium sp. 179-I 3D3 NHS]|uniref:Lrp/AsnC family transcriptional regulator n=1 Tax=unclassified Microbacterium TaxID=2609290 RepID=UPI0039A1FB31
MERRGEAAGLDDIDRAILDELRRDARASMTAIADAVHISRAGAHARIRRLTDLGVITGYSVRTDPVLLGHHASAYVTLAIEQATWQEVRDRLRAIPEIEHMALVGGDFDVILLVRANDARDLRRIVLEDIQAIPSIRSTRTTLIFEDFTRE